MRSLRRGPWPRGGAPVSAAARSELHGVLARIRRPPERSRLAGAAPRLKPSNAGPSAAAGAIAFELPTVPTDSIGVISVRTTRAAKMIGLSASWLRKARAAGTGPPCFRVSRTSVLYPISGLQAWVASRPLVTSHGKP